MDENVEDLGDFPLSFNTFSPRQESSETDANASTITDVQSKTQIVAHDNPRSVMDLIEQIQMLDAATGGLVRRVLVKLRARAFAPFPLDDWVDFCSLCGTYSTHETAHHLCRICHRMGEHKGDQCSVEKTLECTFCGCLTGHVSADHCCLTCHVRGEHASCTTSSPVTRRKKWMRYLCEHCQGRHDTAEHICRNCRAKGQHRSASCPEATTTTYAAMIDASIVSFRDRLQRSTGLLPTTLQSLVQQTMQTTSSSWADMKNSSAVLNEVEYRLRQGLHRLGLWGAGSQTPISTPRLSAYGHVSSPPAVNDEQPTRGIVISYREGASIVSDRLLKYMRLLMHTKVSTNAFDVVVQANVWELKRPGMVSPKSFPPSPRTQERYRKHMESYTQSVLLGARKKLEALTVSEPVAN
ncbi:Transducin (beta)-like 1 X-linked receptor 1 [Aphanomyces cochlioides]|nr:Transducin (beta)-like 1 X-linked receptor 1 [Aphanomyces cochlioides]